MNWLSRLATAVRLLLAKLLVMRARKLACSIRELVIVIRLCLARASAIPWLLLGTDLCMSRFLVLYLLSRCEAAECLSRSIVVMLFMAIGLFLWVRLVIVL